MALLYPGNNSQQVRGGKKGNSGVIPFKAGKTFAIRDKYKNQYLGIPDRCFAAHQHSPDVKDRRTPAGPLERTSASRVQSRVKILIQKMIPRIVEITRRVCKTLTIETEDIVQVSCWAHVRRYFKEAHYKA
jgi:hypothetical protein